MNFRIPERPNTPTRGRAIVAVLAVFALAFLLFSLRNLDPIVYPSLYGEDGKWTANLLSNGFWDTAFGARVFPVLGFVMLYQLAQWILGVFFAGNLYYLPLVYFVLANMFLAAVVTAAYTTLRGRISRWALAAILIAIVLAPVGDDANEIYGRILNLGFFFPFLQVLLLLRVMAADRNRGWIALAVGFSLLSGLTFPVGVAVSLACGGLLLLRHFREGGSMADLGVALAILVTALIPLLLLTGASFESKGGADLPIKHSAYIEFAVARSILYPFVFYFYRHLNDAWALVGLAALVVVVGLTVLATRRSKALSSVSRGYPLAFIWAATLAYAIAMIGMRSGLTSLFNDYMSTFPDRYFVGLNLLLFTSVVLTLCRLRHGGVVAGILAVPFLVTASLRFELADSTRRFNSVDTWTESLCDAIPRVQGRHVLIPIPPEGWVARVPTRNMTVSLAQKCAGPGPHDYRDLPVMRGFQNDAAAAAAEKSPQ